MFTILFLCTPTLASPRAVTSAHISRSFCVYAATVGIPVVPLVECTSFQSSLGAACKSKGYVFLKSSFVINGSNCISSNVLISSGYTLCASYKSL